MKTIVKGKERLMAEIKANAESVINTEKATMSNGISV